MWKRGTPAKSSLNPSIPTSLEAEVDDFQW